MSLLLILLATMRVKMLDPRRARPTKMVAMNSLMVLSALWKIWTVYWRMTLMPAKMKNI